ncbi:MAG TPA: 2-succinyl-5-enolpyruvyl-6-hydroxy-3-cyclohexene-1-carboxylic-acid synthase [Capillimicrobium sp.]|nr:2-succinyl-5-enolpyruvyl-6-hydroxy-3-cyclohexene-1-carboxylic-acid synthase [Capillimicrobium sp.]
MSATADSYLVLRAFVDELVRSGVTDAVTSPGSRSTPIVLSLVRDGRLRCHSHVDERAAAFFALGAAKATRRPVAIACTSGTAAAEYLPAVIEAHEAGVPLIVLTADRPPELRDTGAGQTIDQVKLYGSAVRWYVDLGIHEATPDRLRWVRSLACRVAAAAAGAGASGRPGPVQVNVPLREPLVLDEPLGGDPLPGRPGGRPWLAFPAAAPASSGGTLAAALGDHERPLIVAGRGERDPELADALGLLAAAAGAPLLADPLSGARRGDAAIAHYDALLRDAGFAAAHRPDLVIRVGDLPTSKPLRAFLAGLGDDVPQLAFSPDAVWHDPAGALHALLSGDPGASVVDAIHALGGEAVGDRAWLAAWRRADAAAGGAIAATLGDGALSEPLVARTLAGVLPDGHVLVVASSMPVRDLETFAAVRDGGPRVLSNRGANGIDGTVASALGVAATGAPTTLLIGDVALAYDHSALLAVPRLGLAPAIVVLDNGGGGIFDFLPVATQADAYEAHVATPPGLDPERIAALYGLAYAPAATVAELRDAVGAGGARLIHVRTDRAGNVALHRRVWDAVAAAIGG